jgi:GTPase SAR1 family protein
MANDKPPSHALNLLQSADQMQLLDEIDKLRSHGISHYVSLPQLIVCGDQSSGKSSVLEAISGISFPTKDNLCTRFATEVILRKNTAVNLSVAIVPSQTRSEDECERLSQFRETLEDLKAFPDLIEKAKDVMGVTGSSNAFSNDVLRVEISGPDKPHLTIVDLPGLIHSENKLQSAADVTLVGEMVQRYMRNERSIILAVISAQNDYANQIVLKLAKGVDPTGRRTLGIITKPDTLHERPESEMAFVNLARNEDVEFRLGWHVLRNRDYRSRDSSMEARDRAEMDFLSQGVWKDLPRTSVGIAPLRERLSRVLLDQIKAELPSLVEEIQISLNDCQSKLAKLGTPRNTVNEQRMYLLEISQSFQSLTKAAVDGTYSDPFFGNPGVPVDYDKRLRAVVQNLNLDFAEAMRLYGHSREISENITSLHGTTKRGPLTPRVVSRAEFIQKIRELLRTSRGRELPGMFNPLIVGDLFSEQSEKWEHLAQAHLRETTDMVRNFLQLALSHLTDETTSQAILREIIDPHEEHKSKTLAKKLEELSEPHQKGHPITYNHYFIENIQKMRQKILENELRKRLTEHLGLNGGRVAQAPIDIGEVASKLAAQNIVDMDEFACSEILLCMEAYYKVGGPSVCTVLDAGG